MAGIEMYEVMALLRKIWDGGKEAWALLFAALFLAAFAYFGWKHAAGEETVFPVFHRACAWVDGFLEQAGEGQGVIQTIGELFHEAFFHAAAGSF